MWSKFLITDGTKEGTINLLPYYKEWLPQLAPSKGGGYWSGSTYTDGRQLFSKQLDNIIDTFLMNVFTGSMLDTINLINKITTLLDKGVGYWVNDWQNESVWIEMCPECQSESQYAVIMDWSIPNIDEIFVSPFNPAGTLEDISLILEHGLWLENEPGTGTAIDLQTGTTESDLITPLIDADSGSKVVWISNFWRNHQITHVFIYDAAPGVWTNITGLSSVALFPAVPAVGDILYVGCTSANPGSPFDNIIFNIDTASAGLTIVSEIWNGAAWVAIPGAWNEVDDTSDFTNTGRNVFVFDPPWTGATIWAPVAVNAVTAWWVRFRVTVAAAPTTPTIVEQIYTNERPFFEIPAEQVPATYNALGQFRNWRRDDGQIDHDTAANNAMYTSLFYGFRSVDRGEHFIGYLQAVDNATIPVTQQTPYGIIFNIVAANTTNATSVKIPWYNYTHWNPAGAVSGTICYWELTTYNSEYKGTYRLFMRGREVGVAGTIKNRIKIYNGAYSGAIFTTPWRYNQSTNDEVIDFGLVTFPEINILNETGFDSQTYILIEGDTPGTASDYYYYDIILIPVDELAIEVKITPAGNNSSTFYSDKLLIVDSISNPKYEVSAKNYSEGITSTYNLDYHVITPGELYFSPNTDMRVWCFGVYDDNFDNSSAEFNRAVFHSIFTPWAYRNSRYKMLRGEQ